MPFKANGKTVASTKIDGRTVHAVALIKGTRCTAIFYNLSGTLRDGYYCSRASGNYATGDTHWRYTYQYSYDGTTWYNIATSTTGSEFSFNVAEGTKKLYLRAVQVDKHTWGVTSQTPIYTTFYNPYSSVSVHAENNSNGNYSQTSTVSIGGSVTISNNKVTFTYSGSRTTNAAAAPYMTVYNGGTVVKKCWIKDNSDGYFTLGVKVSTTERNTKTYYTTSEITGYNYTYGWI